MLTKELLGNWLFDRGYTKDKFGHYQKTIVDPNLDEGKATVRFKMQANSIRYEKQAKIGGHNEWIRLYSGYYKNISITEDGKLTGMKR